MKSSVKPAISFQSKEFTEIFGLSPTEESHRHHSSEDDSGPSYLVHFPSDDSIDELFKSSSGATSQVLTHTVTGDVGGGFSSSLQHDDGHVSITSRTDEHVLPDGTHIVTTETRTVTREEDSQHRSS